ncbi:uncharacterized protein [Lolium perenne]|uniref:uncharacterized protein n=1 Tax=Lolium perenne TaxID=4522 RepID=UPI0021EAEAC1|nr:uncharacterized protein LOC127331674 [Lolium perenne]XP_051213815.1 uncharacterized protein LOC127331674 [Lolium perenne]XP_051213816.1 uncharacterized protein LOC127331674 [Lolium perenne]XP_051213817.1 uncharacterized protein LOC127331674 [Lolium perenne]
MAVADDTAKPSPPPPRIVVVVLALVPFVLAPMLALGRIVGVAAQALPYLGYGVIWVLAAASAAKVVAARAWGDGSAPSVFLQALTDAAFKVSLRGTFLLLALAAVLLCGACLAFMVAAVSGSGSEFKKGALGAFKQHSTREFFPRTAVLGWVAYVPFMLLLFTGYLIQDMMPSPVEGSISKGEMIGSVIVDVGVVGTSAISCFVVIPALALRNWRDNQSDRKAGLTV